MVIPQVIPIILNFGQNLSHFRVSSTLMFNNFCPVTDISATVTSIGVKFRVMIHISPGIVLSTLESGTPKMVQWGRIDSRWPVAALTARSEARYWFRIAISVYPTCIRRPC